MAQELRSSPKQNGAGASAAQRLEEAKARHRELIERRARVQAEFEAASRQLEQARQEAVEQFGTGDLDALRKMYVERERENEQAVEQFVRALNEREAALREAEAALAG
jgi:hypothetical protein